MYVMGCDVMFMQRDAEGKRKFRAYGKGERETTSMKQGQPAI